jgi:surface protein
MSAHSLSLLFAIAFISMSPLVANAAPPFCGFNDGTVRCGELGLDATCTLNIGNGNQIFTRRNESSLRSLINNAKMNPSEWGKVSTTCTTGIQSMKNMFFEASSFNEAIGHWDTSSVIDMYGMFSYAPNFNQSISNWDTSIVTDMSHMFRVASIFNQNIAEWKTSKVKNAAWMFNFAFEFNQDLSTWCMRTISNDPMFTFRLSNPAFEPLFGQTVKSCCGADEKFVPASVSSLTGTCASDASGNPSTSSSCDIINNTVRCERLVVGATCTLDIGDGTGKQTFTRRSEESLKALGNDPADWGKFSTTCTTGIQSMKNMFNGFVGFNEPIGHWDTSNVTDMSNMFVGATSFNQHISRWDTSKVTFMSHMFSNARVFNKPIGGWKTSNVTYMSHMFWGASNFNQDISNWDTPNVIAMHWMFRSASSFNQRIGGWKTSNVASMNYMFWGASNFSQDISTWCVRDITEANRFEFQKGSPLEAVGLNTSFLPLFGQTVSSCCLEGFEYFELHLTLQSDLAIPPAFITPPNGTCKLCSLCAGEASKTLNPCTRTENTVCGIPPADQVSTSAASAPTLAPDPTPTQVSTPAPTLAPTPAPTVISPVPAAMPAFVDVRVQFTDLQSRRDIIGICNMSFPVPTA